MRGGANGARIRLAPQTDWDANDPDEFGCYYLPGTYLDPADLVADGNGADNFAVLEDLPIRVYAEDNAARSNADDNTSVGSDFDDFMDD